MRAVPAILVLALAALFCLSPLAEVDFFWHLLAGRQILDTGRAPRVDTFTYTSEGRPWTDLHWIFQAGAAWVERHAGWGALDALKVIVVVAAFAAALGAARIRGGGMAAAVLALPGVVAAQERFTLRPEIVSFAFLGLLLLILARRDRAPGLLFAVPPLLALWANVHALFAVGLAVLVLALAGDLVERLRGGPGAALRPLALAAAAAVPCTLLTPYGLAGWSLPGTLLLERVASGAGLYGRSIAEFQAPFSGFGRTASVAAFAILIAMVAAAVVAGYRACRPADLLLLGAFLALALMARRNMPLFAIVAIACASPAAVEAWRRGRAWLTRHGVAGARAALVTGAGVPVLVATAAMALMADVATNRFFARDGTQRSFGVGIAPSFYPEAAADFVLAGLHDGEVLNDMTMGGYLAWRWFPARRVYIDGRLEVHDPALFATYLGLQQDPRRFEAEAAARGIKAVIWSHQHALDAAPLLRHLASGGGWRLAHVDLAAAVFVRAAAAGGEAIPAPIDRETDPPTARLLAEAERAAERARAADPLPGWMRGVLPRVEVPAAETGAALFFAILGRGAVAEPLLRDAVRRAPRSAVLRYDLALVLAQGGRVPEAAATFEQALALDPGFGAARAGLALMRLKSGDEEGALAAWARAERDAPLPPSARQARGALLAARGRVDEAIGDYRAALRGDPGRADWLAELALLYAGRGMMDPAREAIARARALDPSACRPRVAEARILRASGEADAAAAVLRAALADDPRCDEARRDLDASTGGPRP